jgi:hypothetical protein
VLAELTVGNAVQKLDSLSRFTVPLLPKTRFQELARTVHTHPPSPMRMFGPKGNPSASNLLALSQHCKTKGINFALKVAHRQSSRSLSR